MGEAWDRVGPGVMAKGHEFEARLARRRALADAPPPRPFCAVIRANDTRITPMRAQISPASAVEKGQEAEHRVMVDSGLLKFVTTLVNIPAPGVQAQKASEILGVSVPNIFRLIRDHRLGVRYIPLLGGKRGRPIPLVHTRGDFDPCAGGVRQLGAERMWDGLLRDIPASIPCGLDFEVKRIPYYGKGWGGRFAGWRWLCPACGRSARSLFLPLTLPDFALLNNIPIPAEELEFSPTRPVALACRTCHRCFNFSGRSERRLAKSWQEAIRYLSTGMLYSGEVERPDWLRVAPSKVRHFLERDTDYFAHEAERRQREEFSVKLDSSPMWVNGKLNPIFDEPLPEITIDPLTNKTVRGDGTPDGLWRPGKKRRARARDK